MNKAFNTTGTCFPAKHYMVDLSGRLKQIARMVDAGRYFCINRARQYGKSTVIYGLSPLLAERYIVFSLSFQRMSAAKFRDEDTFCRAFISRMQQSLAIQGQQGHWPEYMDILAARAADFHRPLDLTDMFDDISLLCSHSPKPVILIIDEVDNACNNQIFVDFLGQLRDLYLNRELTPTFQSVILAGVYNVKNLRSKEGSDSGSRYNSPWNIADDFTIDMRFHPEDIAGMLQEYESEHHTGMDIAAMSRMIFDYTDGYPYMVSRLCKLLDERIPETNFVPRKDIWTKEGLLAAIRLFLKEPNTLFEDMVKKPDEYPDLKGKISDILFRGTKYTFEIDSRFASIGCIFGFLKEDQGFVAIANRLFETKLYNLLLAESEGCSGQNPAARISHPALSGPDRSCGRLFPTACCSLTPPASGTAPASSHNSS